MNTRFYISLSLLLFMFSSCSRTPEQILSRNWGINVNKIEHRVDSFKDKWYPNGDGECEVKMHIVLSNKDLEQLFQFPKSQTSLIILSVYLGLKGQALVSTITNPKGAKPLWNTPFLSTTRILKRYSII